MEEKILISLRSARINSGLLQIEVVSILKSIYNIKITRQKLSDYELDSTEVPINLADALCKIYNIPEDNIFFGDESTLSYTFRNKLGV